MRIEDTDRARFVKEAEKAIMEILKWLEITWDGEVIMQSKRLSLYKEHAEILKRKQFAYEDSGAIRFKMPKAGQTSWADGVGNKTITFDNKIQEDFIIIKSDGYPTYNFASVVDDHLMNITHVIRGEEFISSTPKHIQLYKAFDWELPVFVHLPVILGSDKQKLSKRHGAKSVLEYREEGYLKEALLNYMVLLGWNPGGDQEILSLDEMITLFDLSDVNTASPIFDAKKLEWMNGVYIRNLSSDEFKSRLFTFDKTLEFDLNVLASSEKQDLLLAVAKTRIKTLADFRGLVFRADTVKPFTEEEKQIAQKLVLAFSQVPEKEFSEKLLSTLKEFTQKEQVSMKKLYYLLMRREQGLPLVESAEIFGKQWFLDNLSK